MPLVEDMYQQEASEYERDDNITSSQFNESCDQGVSLNKESIALSRQSAQEFVEEFEEDSFN